LRAAALLYALSGFSLLGLWRRPPEPRTAAREKLWREAGAGLATVAREPSLRGLAIAYSLYQFGWGVLVPAVPVALARSLGGAGATDLAVGGLWALAGLASGFGALAAGRFSTAGRERHVLALGMLASAAALYPLGGGLGIAGLALAVPLIGLCAGPIDVGLLSLRQRRTDPARLGRVLAVSMSLNQSGMPAGAAVGGIIVAHSLPAAFAAAALAAALGAVAALLIPADHKRKGISAGVRRQ
jgi:predicted MFS family arabinose efflux permease